MPQREVSDQEIYYYCVKELAKKFRFYLEDDKIAEFATDLRRYIMEFDTTGLMSVVLKQEFERLFEFYKNGMIKEYELPNIEYYVSKYEHEQIVEYAEKLEKEGKI